MELVIVIVCVVMIILILFMFLILKNTVKIVNNQTKSYFVNKLQDYDDLILAKENKLNEIEELLKNKKQGNKEENELNKESGYAFDTDVIDLFNQTQYRDNNIFELNKKIEENFNVNYEELIKDFISLTKGKNNYKFCLNLRDKFTSDVIYTLKTKSGLDREEYYKELLTEEEFKVYEAFKVIVSDNSVENFISYLDELISLNDPTIKILVGNKKENYDYLNKYIKTIYSDKIYKGIKIIYRDKIYDFSLSERN